MGDKVERVTQVVLDFLPPRLLPAAPVDLLQQRPHVTSGPAHMLLFLSLDIEEVLASQRQMLERRGRPAPTDDEATAATFRRHLADVEGWLEKQSNIQVLYVVYNTVIAQPAVEIKRVNDFLGGGLDTTAMAQVIDHALHRQRRV